MRCAVLLAATALATSFACALATPARADEPAAAPYRASWHPKHLAQFELHGAFALGDEYGPGGGAGLRVTVPVAENTPFKRIDDTIGISIGLDWIRYGTYRPLGPGKDTVRTDAFYVPLAVPLDVWLGNIAIFVEPTVVWRFTSYGSQCAIVQCDPTSRVFPTGAVGVRIRTAERVALTIRASWPMFTLGGSWI
jgi:hypothetical protein